MRLAFVLLLAGCPAPDPSQGIDPTAMALDYNFFVCNVQPVLVRHCSYLACHGNPQHALRIYSPGKLREQDDGTRDTRDAILTADEVTHNYQSAMGMVLTATPAQRALPDVQHVQLLGKPLARRAGGAEHHGIGIFPYYPAQQPSDDNEWNSLVAWVQGSTQSKPLSADCQMIFDTMGLMPQP
jgi:hypothetical protein